MITLYKGLLDQINGVGLALTLLALLTGLIFAIYLSFKTNRSQKRKIYFGIFMLASLLVLDFYWLSIFYPQGQYVGLGLGSFIYFLPLPAVWLSGLIGFTTYNKWQDNKLSKIKLA